MSSNPVGKGGKKGWFKNPFKKKQTPKDPKVEKQVQKLNAPSEDLKKKIADAYNIQGIGPKTKKNEELKKKVGDAFAGKDFLPQAAPKKRAPVEKAKMHPPQNELQKLQQILNQPIHRPRVKKPDIQSHQIKTLQAANAWRGFVSNGVLRIKNVAYKVIDSTVRNFNQKLVSLGGSGREALLFDPNSQKMKELKKDYLDLISQCTKRVDRPLTSKELAILTNHFMRTVAFDVKRGPGKSPVNDTENLIEELSKKAHHENGRPCISIDQFLEKKTGVCRHHSLVGAALISDLLENKPELVNNPNLQVFVMRDNIPGGGHAWLALSDGGNSYALDSLNNYVVDLNDEESLKGFQEFVGSDAIRHQRKKE